MMRRVFRHLKPAFFVGFRRTAVLVNVPAVVLGYRIAGRLPVKAVRIIAAVVFAGLGVLTPIGVGK